MASTKSQTGVKSLVQSIKKHKNFRQLASYSVQCLVKVVVPPASGWEEALKEAYDAGALEAITSVLQKHAGDEVILSAATHCLQAMATVPEYAQAIVESGCMKSLLESALANPAGLGVSETLNVLQEVAAHAPESLLAAGCVDTCAQLIDKTVGSEIENTVAFPCIRVLEKLNRVQGAATEIQASGVLPTLTNALNKAAPAKSQEESIASPILRLLDRMARSKEVAQYIEDECDGLKLVSTALKSFKDNEDVCRVGGRLLTKLAAGSIESLVRKLEQATDPEERQYLSSLLANLALEEEAAEKIIAVGGSQALIDSLVGSAEAVQTACASAIARLAASSIEHASQLYASGALQKLLTSLDDHKSHDLSISCLTALLSLLKSDASGAHFAEFVALDGPKAACGAGNWGNTMQPVLTAVSGLLEFSALADFALDGLLEDELLNVLASGLQHCLKDKQGLLDTLLCLVYSCTTEENAYAMFQDGIVDAVLRAVEEWPQHAPICQAAFFLLASIAHVEQAQAALSTQYIGRILQAASQSCGATNVQVKAEIRELISLIASSDTSKAFADELPQLVAQACQHPTAEAMGELRNLINMVGALAMVPDYCHHIVGEGDGVASNIASTLVSLSNLKPSKAVAAATCACIDSLLAIAQSFSSETSMLTLALNSTGAVEAVIQSLKKHTKASGGQVSYAKFLDYSFGNPETVAAFCDQGGVEACVSLLRSYPDDTVTVLPALRGLLKMCATEDGSLSIARHGGTRQLMATIKANKVSGGSEDRKRVLELCVAILHRVCENPDGADILLKQGGVDAVLDAADALGAKSTAAQSAIKALTRLLSPADVSKALETVGSLVQGGASSKIVSASTSAEVFAAISRLGNMAAVPEHCDAIVRGDGPSHIIRSITSALELEDKVLGEEAIISCMAAVGNLAQFSDALDISPMVDTLRCCLHSGSAIEATFNALAKIARIDSNAALLVADIEMLSTICETVKQNSRKNKTVLSAFACMKALAKNSASAAMVAQAGGLRLMLEWLDNQSEEAGAKELSLCLAAVARVVCDELTVQQAIHGGIMETIKNSLAAFVKYDSSMSDEKCDAAKLALSATCSVLTSMMCHGSAESMISLAESACVRRLMKSSASCGAYFDDERVATGLLHMIHSCCGDPALASDVMEHGAVGVVLGIMDSNGNSNSILELASSVLQALGIGQDAGDAAVADMNTTASSLEAATSITDSMVEELGEKVKNLSTVMLLDGVVHADNAPQIMDSLSSAVALLAESGASGAAVAAGVQSVGRVAAMFPHLDTDDALEFVGDAWALHAANKTIVAACINTVNSLTNGPQALEILTSMKTLTKLMTTARDNSDDEEIRQAADAAMQKISDVLLANSALLDISISSAVATQMLLNAASDKTKLEGLVQALSSAANGNEMLWKSIQALVSAQKLEVLDPVMHALRDQTQVDLQQGMTGTTPPDRVAALIAALGKALSMQTDPSVPEASKQLSLALADDSLTLLSVCEFSAESAEAAAKQGCVGFLMTLMEPNLEDPNCFHLIISSLRGIMSNAGAEAAQSLNTEKNMGLLSQALAMYSNAEGDSSMVLADLLDTLLGAIERVGADEAKVERELFRQINAVLKRDIPDQVFEPAEALRALLQDKFDDSSAQAMTLSLSNASATVESLQLDFSSGALSQDEEAVVAETMRAVRQSAEDLPADNIVEADAPMLGQVVRCLNAGSHTANALVAVDAAHVLRKLATKQENCMEIARQGGIDAVIAAVRQHPTNKELLHLLLDLIERISRHDEFKAAVAKKGGVDVVINIGININYEDVQISTKCLSTLANLAFNSETNIKLIMDTQGVSAIETAMQAHPAERRLLENAMCALSNLMYGSDENKLTIGQTCGDEVTHVVRVHHSDANLFKMALRALGNLAYCDENIRFVVAEHGATRFIVLGMKHHQADEEALQLAMEVLGNFASLEEEPDTDNPEWKSIAATMFEEEGPQTIVGFMKKYKMNTAILKSGVDALSNVANDSNVTEMLTATHGLISTATEIVRMYDWDEELIQHALPLLATLTYTEQAVEQLAADDGVPLVQNALEQQLSILQEIEDDVITQKDILEERFEVVNAAVSSAMVALTNLCAVQAGRSSLKQLGGVESILSHMSRNEKRHLFVQEALLMLTRCSSDDALAVEIANKGMHVIMQIIDNNMDNETTLTACFRLLGHLAFLEQNLAIIVQHEGIQKIVAAIAQHADCRDLMVRTIQTLDNIAMASADYARLVIEENGRDLIEMIVDAFHDDDEILSYGKSALMSINSLDKLAQSEAAARRAAEKAAAERAAAANCVVDPLKDDRHFLSAGQVVSVWTKGAAKPAHVLVSTDFRTIVWQESSGARKKLGAVDLGSVSKIDHVPGAGHNLKKGAFKKAANPDCCVTVQCEKTLLCFECTVPTEARKWSKSLNSLLDVFRRDKSLLVV